MKRISAFSGLVLFAMIGWGGTAFAHAEFDPATAEAGAPATLTLGVPNERTAASTIKVELQLPLECAKCVITPLSASGWTGKFENSVITWSGGKISGTDRVTFSFKVDALPGEGKLIFKALQTYDNGEVVRWVEPPLADGSEPQYPAPEFIITAGATTTTPSSITTVAPASTTSVPVITTTVAAPTTVPSVVAPAKSSDSDSNTGTVIAILVAIGVLIGAGLAFAKARRAKN